MCVRSCASAAMVLFFLSAGVLSAAPATLATGRVVDGDGKGMPGVLAMLLEKGFSDTTDSDGNFTLVEGQATLRASRGPVRQPNVALREGVLRLQGGSSPAVVRIRVLNSQGRRVGEPFDGLLAPNTARGINPFGARDRAGLAQGVYVMEVLINGSVSRQKVIHLGPSDRSRTSSLPDHAESALAKSQAAVDTLKLTKDGCPSRDIPVAQYGADLGEIELLCGSGVAKKLGEWPLSETSGTTFADAVGSNDAVLTVPDWTVATHECNRLGIAEGSDKSLEVSNGGPAIPMDASYKHSAMSFVVYVDPRSELRGVQYWNSNDPRFGREFIAFCDNGSTPGSFAIERRRFSATQWRLDGYVRDGAGVAQRFSGGLSGIAGATLPVDSARRIVLTEGPTGATLFLNGIQVASLPSVTSGWSSLTAPINLGSSSSTGHANDRSPLWGRLDEIEVWQGQLSLAEVQARPAAKSSRLWTYPSDFVGGSTDINIANYAGNPQAAMDAASAAGRYVYQNDADTTWYTHALNGIDNMIEFKPGCKGLLGVRLRMPVTGGRRFSRIVMMDVNNQMGGHNDRFAASGGYKFIGCMFDGYGRGQNWFPKPGQAGFTYHAFDLEQAHALFVRSSSAQGFLTITVDGCTFSDGTGDALSLDTYTKTTSKSNRFYGYFRGSHVVNGSPQTLNALRFESFNRNGFTGVLNGCGMQDIEAFSGEGSTAQLTFRDGWAESDFDDENEGTAANNSFSHYVNCHMLAGAFYLNPSGDASDLPTQDWTAQYCTFSYHKHFFNYPPEWWKGFPGGDNGYGCLFDHCVFLANGTPYQYHDAYTTTPVNTDVFGIYYQSAAGANQGPRLWTMRNCEWRPKNLPSGTPTANVNCISQSAMSTALSVELDGVTIDAAFADLPFAMGGVTVRYRNVKHERTGSAKPWSGAGAEVAF